MKKMVTSTETTTVQWNCTANPTADTDFIVAASSPLLPNSLVVEVPFSLVAPDCSHCSGDRGPDGGEDNDDDDDDDGRDDYEKDDDWWQRQ